MSVLDEINWFREADMASSKLIDRVRGGFYGIQEQAPDLFHCKQVHGTGIVAAGEPIGPDQNAVVEADGVFTVDVDRPIGVKTADCLPIIATGWTPGEDRPFAMVLHCGWKGLVRGMLAEGVECIKKHGFEMDEVQFLLGPCIQQEQFEVGPEVVEEFVASDYLGAANQQRDLWVTKGQGDRLHIDMQALAVLELVASGARKDLVHGFRICTKLSSDFFSYRREGPGSGRNYSWVKLIPYKDPV